MNVRISTRALAAACFLISLSGGAQMSMPMPGSKPASTTASKPAAKSKRTLPQEKSQASTAPQHETPQPSFEVPFGRLADGDTSTAPRPVMAVPVAGDAGVQEQEHPQQRTGSETAPMPDLLADARSREPQPLQFFTDRATARNPTLREAQAQVRRLQAEAKQAALWQNPEVGYEADHVRGGSYAGGEQGGYVQQTIPLAGQRSSSRAAVDAEVRTAQIVAQAQSERVQSAVQQAFYAALAEQREITLREQMAQLAADNAVAMHQYANVGQADAPDVLGSEVEREQARLELASAQHSYRKAFALLAAVSGEPGMPVTLLTGELENVPALPESAAGEAAERSPLIAAAKQDVAATGAQIRSAHAQAGPQLTLKTGLQQDNEPLDSSLRRVGVVGVAQAGLTLPLWNRNQGAVAAAIARQSAAEAEVVRTQTLLRMQAEQAMQDYANSIGQAQRYRDELLPRAQRAVALYDAKYAAMAAAYPQRMAARRMLLQLQMEYTRQLAAAWQSSILLQHGLLQDGLAAPAAPAAVATPTDGAGAN